MVSAAPKELDKYPGAPHSETRPGGKNYLVKKKKLPIKGEKKTNQTPQAEAKDLPIEEEMAISREKHHALLPAGNAR